MTQKKFTQYSDGNRKVRESEVHESLRNLHRYISCLGQLSPGARRKLLKQVAHASGDLKGISDFDARGKNLKRDDRRVDS